MTSCSPWSCSNAETKPKKSVRKNFSKKSCCENALKQKRASAIKKLKNSWKRKTERGKKIETSLKQPTNICKSMVEVTLRSSNQSYRSRWTLSAAENAGKKTLLSTKITKGTWCAAIAVSSPNAAWLIKRMNAVSLLLKGETKTLLALTRKAMLSCLQVGSTR